MLLISVSEAAWLLDVSSLLEFLNSMAATHQLIHFYPEDGGNMYLWNDGSIVHNHTV
jgi:hypothetical protein